MIDIRVIIRPRLFHQVKILDFSIIVVILTGLSPPLLGRRVAIITVFLCLIMTAPAFELW